MEKSMKEEDYDNYQENLLMAVLKFNELFSDYVKQMDPVLWQKAKDYAKDYSETGNIKFQAISERSAETILLNISSQVIFVKNLASVISEMNEEFSTFLQQNPNKSVDEIKKKWLKSHTDDEYTEEDPFGFEKEIDLFIECDHKFDFDKFDQDDWCEYIFVAFNCGKNINFMQKFVDLIEERFEEDSEVYQYYLECRQNLNNIIGEIKEDEE
jgi:hypothetical protein